MAEDLTDLRLQVLRTLDKYDRVGDRGVFDLLTTGRVDASGAATPGCGLSNGQAMGLIGFLNVGKENLISRRFRLMVLLEETIIGEGGRTAWDALLDMRPVNIGWALDDLWEALSQPQEAKHGDA